MFSHWMAVVVLVCSGVSCSSHLAVTRGPLEAKLLEAREPDEYRIQPGDRLEIQFFYNPELNETVDVRPDGRIALMLIDEVQASGNTVSQLDQTLTGLYSKELQKPEITVQVRSFTGQRVYVGGEVNREGMVELGAKMSALQAVLSAGGFKDSAKPDETLIIRRGPEGEPVPIRVNMADYNTNSSIRLEPYDVVYVPKSFIAKANLFVRQYIQDLLLFRGVSLGFSYDLRYDESVNIQR